MHVALVSCFQVAREVSTTSFEGSDAPFSIHSILSDANHATSRHDFPEFEIELFTALAPNLSQNSNFCDACAWCDTIIRDMLKDVQKKIEEAHHIAD